MARVICLLCFGLFAALSLPSRGVAQVVVVELFTSQGCSSCPPADALLARLADDGDVLVLSLHVDYWDYLGWRDRFARPENTKRQKAYARLAGARSIYTPQAIVQGEVRLVGSDETALRKAIEQELREPARATVAIRPATDAVQVMVEPKGEVHFNNRGLLHLVTYDRPQSVRIERGENAGRTITYVNVVRDWMKIGAWDGKTGQTYSAPLPAMGLGLAVILQDGPVGPILAAARLEP
ncbi:MAG TPA: DUF1223 domain-containing protein [Paracoccaceae bacterium]|nr:DUF1223 domain-containing protein [Paracoccaceae bacterium]